MEDVGDLNRVKFYVCPSCGSIVQGMGGCQVVCCGKTVEPLEVVQADEVHSINVSQIEDDFYNWVNNHQCGSVAPDQDYLNCICKNQVKYMPLGWNKMPLGSSLPDEKLYLIHYNMFFKPWKYTNIMFDNYFWDIAKTTSYYKSMKEQQKNYSQDKKEQDQIAMQNLVKMAIDIAKAAKL